MFLAISLSVKFGVNVPLLIDTKKKYEPVESWKNFGIQEVAENVTTMTSL